VFDVGRSAFANLHHHARRDSNPQPTVLETATLPIELLAFLIFLFRFLLISSSFVIHSRKQNERLEEEF
jgi:hypothetical protein